MIRVSEEWIKIAMEDLRSAEYLIEQALYRMVCYHAQQAVEKILKAILTKKKIEFARTHNVLDLRNAVQQVGYEVLLTDEEAIFLNSIYRARYPADLGLLPSGEPTKEDADKALHIAQEMRDWMKKAFSH